PKGVMVEHANICRLFYSTENLFSFGNEDTWTLFHSISFDFSVWEIWGSLVYGGRLLIISKSTARMPREFYETVCRHGVTVLNQTPSAFKQFSAVHSAIGGDSKVRYVIFGG